MNYLGDGRIISFVIVCFCIIYSVGLMISETAAETSRFRLMRYAIPSGILMLAGLFGVVALIAALVDSA